MSGDLPASVRTTERDKSAWGHAGEPTADAPLRGLESATGKALR